MIKQALVTGAGKRVGAAIAKRLGQAGMHIWLHYNQSKQGAQDVACAIEQAGGSATLIQSNLYEPDSIKILINTIEQKGLGLDILIHNAANFERSQSPFWTDAHLNNALGLNLKAPFLISRGLIPILKQSKGQIIFITCASTLTPYKGYLPYAVSKGALRHMMQLMALELAPDIRVNAIAPGTVMMPIDTPKHEQMNILQGIPVNCFGDPNMIAHAAHYLSQSTFITGEQLLVDGGNHLAV